MECLVAKLTDELKNKILADFHTGKFSQRELAKKYEVSKTLIANIVGGLTPKNDHLVEAQISILSAKESLSETEMTAIMTTAKDEAYNRGLIFNATHKVIQRATQMLEKNTKMEKVSIGDGIQNLEPIELTPLDLKNLQEAIFKGGEALGVVTKVPSTQINNMNAQQTQSANLDLSNLSNDDLKTLTKILNKAD